MQINSTLIKKAQAIKLLVLDVDGVLTNGNIWFDATGTEYKAFNCQDGLGLVNLQQHTQVSVAVISGRASPIVESRLRSLKINHIFLGIQDKLPVLKKILVSLNVSAASCAYMGDDLPDLACMQHSGLSITVANGVNHIKSIADICTNRAGGHGAVREVCDLLIHTHSTTCLAAYE